MGDRKIIKINYDKKFRNRCNELILSLKNIKKNIHILILFILLKEYFWHKIS